MKSQLSKFTEFLRTPFPYLSLALCLFLAMTLLGNTGFRNAMTGADPNANAGDKYEICLVCSGPGAHDAISDMGFTVANFVLIPVTLAATGISALSSRVEPINDTFVFGVYLLVSLLYGLLMPFLIFSVYEAFDARMAKNRASRSVYTG